LSSKKKILILGAGYHQVPLIERAKELGYLTIAISNIPGDVGRSVADQFYPISTLDKDAVLALAQKEKVEGIITIASEIAAPTVAYVAEKLNLCGYTQKQAETISNKYYLRSLLKEAGLTKLSFNPAYSLEDALHAFQKMIGQVMLKPMLASGSKGIKKISSEEELINNFQHALDCSTTYKGVLLEQYVEGKHLGGELIINEGKIIYHLLSEKKYNEHFVTTAHLVPGSISENDHLKIFILLQKVVDSLQLKNGILDVDLVLTSEGPELIELGGRPGGNGIAQLVELYSGVNLITIAIKMAMNDQFEIKEIKSDPMACVVLGSNKKGSVKKINGFEDKLPEHKHNLILERSFVSIGDQVQKFIQGNYQIKNVFITKPSRKELENLVDEIQKAEWVQVS
jgi:biotin carboxylase